MAIEEAIFTLVTGNAAVKALIGLRLYPNKISQDAKLPAAAYQVSGNEAVYTHDGPSRIGFPLFSFTFDARSIDEARAVANAVKPVLSGYKGMVGTTEIKFIFFKNAFEGYNENSAIYIVRQDYKVGWKEV